jgi:hypothetical protein
MNRLTIEERRRIYLAQQRTRETLRARPHSETVGAFAPPSDRGRLRWRPCCSRCNAGTR